MLVLAGDKAWKVVGPRDLEVAREGVADFARGVKHPHARRLAAFGGFLGAVEILERVRAEDRIAHAGYVALPTHAEHLRRQAERRQGERIARERRRPPQHE